MRGAHQLPRSAGVSMRGAHQEARKTAPGGPDRVRLMRAAHHRDMRWPELMLGTHQADWGEDPPGMPAAAPRLSWPVFCQIWATPVQERENVLRTALTRT
jgi:hypothetical protein